MKTKKKETGNDMHFPSHDPECHRLWREQLFNDEKMNLWLKKVQERAKKMAEEKSKQ